MSLRLLLAALGLVSTSAWALEAPATIENARVELRPGVTPAAALADAARGKDVTWVGWSVEAIPTLGDVCCFTNNFKGRGCSLGERESSWGTNDKFKGGRPSDLYVLVEVKEAAPHRIKIFSPDCHVDGANRRVVWLGPVEADASLSTLEKLVDRDEEKISETALDVTRVMLETVVLVPADRSALCEPIDLALQLVHANLQAADAAVVVVVAVAILRRRRPLGGGGSRKRQDRNCGGGGNQNLTHHLLSFERVDAHLVEDSGYLDPERARYPAFN